ncbi:hypothetical protein B0T13DRAFT_513849 [Neurospora crassa]|nr:hypothetical protein B0T13DRAFT_513849 [Neurospora crassa]
MPTYLCHGFRWQRRSIRVYTVVQDLDDVSPEWLIRPTSSRCLLQSFYNLFEFLPYCSPHEPETWDSNEDEDEDEDEDERVKSGEENGEEGVVVPGDRGSRGEKGSKEQRTQWPKRKESLGVLRGHGSEGTTGKGMGTMGKEMGKEKREITAIPVGSNNRSSISRTRTISRSPSTISRSPSTISRSPSLRLPLQGVRTPSRTRLQTTAAAAASAATTPTTPTAPTTATTTSAPASTPASRTPSTLGVSSAGKGRKGKTTGSSSSSRRSESHSPNRKKDELSAQRWSAVKVLEEYDPNNLDEVSRPYAYVADHVVRVDGAADILAEVRRYEERMQRLRLKLKGAEKRAGERDPKANRNSGGSGGSGEYHDALEHLEESAKEKEETWIEQLRDELQRGEEIKWYVVVNGDEERNYSNLSDSDDEDEDEDEDEYEYDDSEELSSSEITSNYGTSYRYDTTEDLLSASKHPSLAAYPPSEGRRSPLSYTGSGSRTSSRSGQSKSRSQSRSHSRTRACHRNHSRPRHGKKIRRPKPTKEQRQHHAQYTLQQELFERNDLRASSTTPTPTPTSATTTMATSTTRGTTPTAGQAPPPPPPTAMSMRNTGPIIKEGAARRVVSEGEIHPALRGQARKSEIPIIMVTPTRSTFPDETETETAGAVGEKRMVEQPQPQQPQPQPQKQQQHHQQQQPQQPQPQPHPQQQQHHQINEPEPGPRRGSTASANPDMGTITSTTVPLTSSFSLDTSPSNAPTPTTIPAGLTLKPLIKPPKKQSTLPTIIPTLPTISTSSLVRNRGNRHSSSNTNTNTGSKRSSLTTLRSPSSWSCLSLHLGHSSHSHHSTSPKDKDGEDITGDDEEVVLPPPRPSPSPPIPISVNPMGSYSYEPVSTLPPRPAPMPPGSNSKPVSPRGGGQTETGSNNKVPTAPSSPVVVKISAGPAGPAGPAEVQTQTHGQGQAAASPVVGQYASMMSRTMPTRKGNSGNGNGNGNGNSGNGNGKESRRSRSSGSLRRLFQRASGKDGWI